MPVPTPFFPGEVFVNGQPCAVGIAPRLRGWGGIFLCNFSRPQSVDGRLTFASFGPHIEIACSDDEFIAAAIPGECASLPGGSIEMVRGYSAVDEGPQTRVIQAVEMRTFLLDGAARFKFTGHTGPASNVKDANPSFGFGPLEFFAWFEVREEELAVFAEHAATRERLAAQLFAPRT